LIKGEDIVKNITPQRIKWWGHLNRIEDTKLVKKITDWNPTGIRTKGRSKNRWSDEVINNCIFQLRPKLEDTTNPTHGDWRLYVQN
jgi:hypothetical protein